MTLDPARRAALGEARAGAIAREHFELDPGTASVATLPFGTVVRDERRAVVIAGSDEPKVLGGILLWETREQPGSVDLVVEGDGGVHARHAELLAPRMGVWSLDGTALRPAEPAPVPPEAPAPVGVADHTATIRRAGATVVVEDGVVLAEIAGLEVGRLVEGTDGWVLEAGVGRLDREAGALLQAGRDPEVALRQVIERVAPLRRAGVAPHPMNLLARERWLREVVRVSPGVAGVVDAETVAPMPARTNLRAPAPAPLLGRDGDRTVLVVCSIGADLGLLPATADLVRRHDPAEVRVVLPRRDLFPSLASLLERLPVPVATVGVNPPWVVASVVAK